MIGELLSGLSTTGKQVHGFGKNVGLTSRFVKSGQLTSAAERLESSFGVTGTVLQKKYASKLRMAQLQLSALKESLDGLWAEAGKIATAFGARDTTTQTSVQTLKYGFVCCCCKRKCCL